MGPSTKSPGFGHKGVNDHVQTLAESLLTGKPVARTQGRDRTPKLKPRAKPRFGRKDAPETVRDGAHQINAVASAPRRRWAVWAVAVVVALVVQVLAGLIDWRLPTSANGPLRQSQSLPQPYVS